MPLLVRTHNSFISAVLEGEFQNIIGGEKVKMRYRVHQFDIKMTRDLSRSEQFLNNLEGEAVTIIPNVSMVGGPPARVDFLFIVEKVG